MAKQSYQKSYKLSKERLFLFNVLSSEWDAETCVLWPYSTCPDGYGYFWLHGKMVSAHRYILQQVIGPPPKGKPCALHSPVRCHNPSCINPLHLRWGSHAENGKDRVADRLGFAPASISEIKKAMLSGDIERISTNGLMDWGLVGKSRGTITGILKELVDTGFLVRLPNGRVKLKDPK